MKNLTVLFPLLVLMIGPSRLFAQPGLALGVKAGPNIATQVTTGEGENVYVENLIRIHGGIYAGIFLTDFLALQPEILLSGKGSFWNDPYNKSKDILTYVDLPVLIRYQPIKFMNIHAGPQFGYLISAIQEEVETGEKIKIPEFYKKADLGLVLGVEANLPLKINLTVRYILGLSTITSEEGYVDPWKNNLFQLSVGYRIFGK